MLQLKIPRVATKTQRSQINKKNFFFFFKERGPKALGALQVVGFGSEGAK